MHIIRNCRAPILLITFIVFFISQLPSAVADEKEVSKEYLQNLYMEYLGKEGYESKVDGDGDVIFKSEGLTFFISVEENDPEFFRIALPNIWSIESIEEKMKVLIAVDDANSSVKTVKLFVNRDNTWASIESFVGSPKHFKVIFQRSLSALKAGVMYFSNAMRLSVMKQQSRGECQEKAKSRKLIGYI